MNDASSRVVLADRDGEVTVALDRGDTLVRLADDGRLEAIVRTLLVTGIEVTCSEGSSGRFGSRLAAWRRSARVELDTLASAVDGWLDNLSANMEVVRRTPPAADLNGLLAGRTVLVVGSGPSRRTLLDELAAWRDRTLVLATNSAVRPLIDVGCVPDGIVVIEGRDCSDDLKGIPGDSLQRTVLFHEASTHPAHLDWPCRSRFVFFGPISAWLAAAPGGSTPFPTGGNAGTTAMVLAWLLGAKPVLVSGIDFAIGRDTTGVRGTAGDPRVEVAGWEGETCEAEWPFAAYLEETESILREIALRESGTPFLNVTPEGARIAGMQASPWCEVRDRLPPDRGPGLDELAAAAAGTNRPRAAVGPAAAGVLERVAGYLRGPHDPRINLALALPSDTTVRSLVGRELLRTHAVGEAFRRAAERFVSTFSR